MTIPRFTSLHCDTAMQEAWARDGVLVIEDAISPQDCKALMARMEAIVSGLDIGEDHSVFDTLTREQENDAYFLNSGNKIRFFLEADATDSSGKLAVPRERALNKVGHALHTLDPVFREFSIDPDFRYCFGISVCNNRIRCKACISSSNPGSGAK